MRSANEQPGSELQPITGETDVVVVRAALAGDAAARQTLAEQLTVLPAMLRFKNVRLGGPLNAHELEDATQNVMLSLWQKLATFDGRVPLVHWAYGFAVVEIHRTIERRTRRRERSHDGDTMPAPDLHPAGDIERVQLCLAGLDDPEREVVRLKHFESLTFDEIGARLGIVTNTAKTRYYRALERLRLRLGGEAPVGGSP